VKRLQLAAILVLEWFASWLRRLSHRIGEAAFRWKLRVDPPPPPPAWVTSALKKLYPPSHVERLANRDGRFN
jgi:hypothetical protein